MRVDRAVKRFNLSTITDNFLGRVEAEVRTITGFDRPIAYRFRHDESGKVVRESGREGLENCEENPCPSSDILAQVRRLYIFNTLRLIADVGALPVPVVAMIEPSSTSLDMSFQAGETELVSFVR